MKKIFVFVFLLYPCFSFALLNKPAAARAASLPPPAIEYQIQVEIDPPKASYKGHQKITFRNQTEASLKDIVLFLYPNDPSLTKSKNKFLNITNLKSGVKKLTPVESGPFVRIPLPAPLLPKQKIELDFDFQAEVPKQATTPDLFTEAMDELLRLMNPQSGGSDYGIFSAGQKIVNLGLWYPLVSHYEGADWDQQKYSGIGDVTYFDPANYKVEITAPAGYTVVTTGSISATRAVGEKIIHSAESRWTRDFAVQLSRDYQELSKTSGLVTVRTYCLKEHLTSCKETLDAGVRALEFYQDAFGPYPYTELDIVEAPLYGGAGGVEFPGLVTISSMLYRDSSNSDDILEVLLSQNPAFSQLLEFVVAHEVAHQWWNAVIGSNSKKHPYIDEAMANHSAILYFEKYYGRESAEKQMLMQMKLNYQLHRILGGSDRAVLNPTSEFKGPLEYSAIVYGKGALYFDRLRQLMGDAAYLSAVRSYYRQFWFRIAEPDDFQNIAKKHAPEKAAAIDGLYARWIKEKHGDEDIGEGTLEALLASFSAIR